MWVLFGGVTLVLWICVEFWRRHLFRWRPAGIRDGLEYNLSKSKGKVTSINVGLSCPVGANFSIKRQSWIDNFFKSIKVSNELESGDQEFDDLCYIISNNHNLQKKLVSSKEFRDSIKQIFANQFPARASALHCRSGRLWVVLAPTNGADENALKVVTRTLKPNLENIKRNLEALVGSHGKRWGDPFVIKAVILLAISSGLAINGAIQLFRIHVINLPVTYDLWPLFWDAVKYGLIGLSVLVVFSIYWLGRSARTHLVLVEMLTIGLCGAIATAYVELRDINIEMDSSVVQTYEVELVQKYESKRRRSRSYFLVLKDWNCDCDYKDYKVEVSYSDYNNFPPSGKLVVTQQTGALGYRWVSNLRAF